MHEESEGSEDRIIKRYGIVKQEKDGSYKYASVEYYGNNIMYIEVANWDLDD